MCWCKDDANVRPSGRTANSCWRLTLPTHLWTVLARGLDSIEFAVVELHILRATGRIVANAVIPVHSRGAPQSCRSRPWGVRARVCALLVADEGPLERAGLPCHIRVADAKLAELPVEPRVRRVVDRQREGLQLDETNMRERLVEAAAGTVQWGWRADRSWVRAQLTPKPGCAMPRG